MVISAPVFIASTKQLRALGLSLLPTLAVQRWCWPQRRVARASGVLIALDDHVCQQGGDRAAKLV